MTKITEVEAFHFSTTNEVNNVFALKDHVIIRLRKTGEYYLTIKGPNIIHGHGVNSRFEFEVKLPKFAYNLFLKSLPKTYYYEKIRHTFVPVSYSNCEICLDKVLGLGEFAEIEAGSVEEVERFNKIAAKTWNHRGH